MNDDICKECGVKFICEIDNPLCYCDECYKEWEENDEIKK